MSSDNPFQSPLAEADAYSLGIDPSHRTLELLRLTRPWVLTVAVFLAIGVGLMVLGTIAVIVTALTMNNAGPASAGVLGVLTVVYAVMTGLAITPMVSLFRYASRIKKFAAGGGVEQLDNALAAQKTFWKSTGIALLVFVVLYVVMIVAMTGFQITSAR